jgi:tRNA (guanine37-N1)-methyltransferase
MPHSFPDKVSFSSSQIYPALSVPCRMTSKFRSQLKHLVLQQARTKNIYPDPNNEKDRRLLILQFPTCKTKGDNVVLSIAQCQEILATDPVLSSLLQPKINETNEERDVIHWYQNGSDGNDNYGFQIQQTYDEMTAEEIFQNFFKKDPILIPSSFEVIGQIAHLNLRTEQLPYKFWIGSVLLEKNQPAIRTVVNKIGSIETTYRTFPMEVLAGYGLDDVNITTTTNNSLESDWSVTTTKEEGCTFQLDFRTVYWNSRLSGEHKRLVTLIKNHAVFHRNSNNSNNLECDKTNHLVVVDLMAGVGPFAVPLTNGHTMTRTTTIRDINTKSQPQPQEDRIKSPMTSSDIIVYANDLNPDSFKYLQINGQQNKCKQLYCYNRDARVFLWELQQEILPQKFKTVEEQKIDHVIMNLPASAPEFLDIFRGWSLKTLPRIHVHCFAPKPQCILLKPQSNLQNQKKYGDDEKNGTEDGLNHGSMVSNVQQQQQQQQQSTYQEAVDRCSKSLGCPIDWTIHQVNVHLVRDVSPGKNMLCVSFTLPSEARHLPPIDVTALSNVSSKDAAMDNTS